MTKERLKEVQCKQLEIMDAIHKVCTENHITYYLIGGSCLGAIRHKGFIPWDADIDIAMPRKDYDRFFNEVCSLLPPQFVAHTYKTDKMFYAPHGLVCLEGSVLLTKADLYDTHVPKFGIYIDVMPLDVCPVDLPQQHKHKNGYLRLKKLKKLKISRIYKENNFLQKCIKIMLRMVLYPISVRRINQWQEKVMIQYNHLIDSPYWCSIASKYRYEKQLMDKSIYGTPKLAPFEDRMYYIPEKTDIYLSKIYGDYMSLPSEEEQEKMYNYFEVARW